MTDHTSETAGSENGRVPAVSPSGATTTAPSAAPAPAPAPPPPPADAAAASAERKRFFDHADALAKLATLALGVFYVFGILTSNIQLMDLGVSDFASLQARNVLTGFFFVAYFVGFLVLLAPIVVAAVAFGMRWWKDLPTRRKRFQAGIVVLVVCGSYIFIFVTVINWALGFVYPWGSPDAPFSQFARAYLNLKIFAAGFIVSMIAGGLAEISTRRPELRLRPVLIVFAVTIAVIVPLVLSAYANEVYPNIKYNAGGGQPQIAAVVLAGKKSEIAGADTAGLPAAALCCEGSNRAEPVKSENPEQSIKTGPVVVWYQSDKFIYLSALGEVSPQQPAPARMVAIDIKLVRRIEYLPRYVEIHDGNKIEKIYQRDADGTVSPLPAAAASAAAPGEAPPAPARPAGK
jgi:hypothetical protein